MARLPFCLCGVRGGDLRARIESIMIGGPYRPFTVASRVALAFAAVAVVAGPLIAGALGAAPTPIIQIAQDAGDPISFEVASIKRNKEAEAQRAAVPVYVPVVPGRAQTLPGGLVRGCRHRHWMGCRSTYFAACDHASGI